jgi:alkyl sulfatase BDS1-like metallo-beta-lactamase superfamily hydrolase
MFDLECSRMRAVKQVMETRMAVDEAQSQEELRPLRESNLEQIHACEETLAQAFDRSDFSAAQEGMIRLTYLCRIKDVILSKTD